MYKNKNLSAQVQPGIIVIMLGNTKPQILEPQIYDGEKSFFSASDE